VIALRIVFVIVLSILASGCLEQVGRPPYNHATSSNYVGLCHLEDRPGGDFASYRCDQSR
jgi:hypothetical protein